jgi:hypothetical protein
MAAHPVPLHVSSRVFVWHEHLMSTIDHQLQLTEQICELSACDVTLTGDQRMGYRAAVALELTGGRCISSTALSFDIARAIGESFSACRVKAASEAC